VDDHVRRDPAPGAGAEAAQDIEPGDTGGYSSLLLLDAIADLLIEVTSHLGREGALIADRVLNCLEAARNGLTTRSLGRDRTLTLIESISVDERRLRDMIAFDYADATCRHTRASLDKLRTAITHLSRQLLARVNEHDVVQH
jgi:hypothetical protein